MWKVGSNLGHVPHIAGNWRVPKSQNRKVLRVRLKGPPPMWATGYREGAGWGASNTGLGLNTTKLFPTSDIPGHLLGVKEGGAESSELSDPGFQEEETVSAAQEQKSRKDRETRRRRLLLRPRPQVPKYATWVGACRTHPRARCHSPRVSGPARPNPALVRALAAPGLHGPRRRHLLLQP